jgi:hypothetical protein
MGYLKSVNHFYWRSLRPRDSEELKLSVVQRNAPSIINSTIYMKKYGGAKTKTQKTREICEQENKDFNTVTKRCLKKCVPGKERGENFRCKTTRKNRAICERENKDFNLYTERCVKKCAPGKERDAKFKCIKIKLPTSAVEDPNISRKDATDLLNFVAHLEEVGSKYENTGIHFKPNNLLGMIMYDYLIEKYNVNCSVYGFRQYYMYQVFTIELTHDGLYGTDKIRKGYQKYVYKMIKLIMNCIQQIQNSEQEILIIPLNISYVEGVHSNMLIYRKSLNVIEHYEPHGKTINSDTSVNSEIKKVMEIIINKMNKTNELKHFGFYPQNITYIPPENICFHSRGFQTIENKLFLKKNITNIERGGICMIWSIFFAELTLANPQLPSKEIFNYVFTHLHNSHCDATCKPVELKTRNIIRGYLDVMYNNINNIIQKIGGVNIEHALDNGGIDNVEFKHLLDRFTEEFSLKYFAHIQDKFKNKNKKDMNIYFKEQNSAKFNTLSPSNI